MQINIGWIGLKFGHYAQTLDLFGPIRKEILEDIYASHIFFETAIYCLYIQEKLQPPPFTFCFLLQTLDSRQASQQLDKFDIFDIDLHIANPFSSDLYEFLCMNLIID